MFENLQKEYLEKKNVVSKIKGERIDVRNNLRDNIISLEDQKNKLEIEKNNLEKEIKFKEADNICIEIKEMDYKVSNLKERLSVVEKTLEDGWDELKKAALCANSLMSALIISGHERLQILTDENKKIQAEADERKMINDILWRDTKWAIDEIREFNNKVQKKEWSDL